MRQIRYNTFETNSSSTHTLIIMTKDEYDKLCNGELYIDDYGHFGKYDSLVTKEDVEREFKGSYGYDDPEDERRDSGVYTLDEWSDDDFLEYDEHTYTSPSGDEIVAIAKYGRDG